MRGSGVWRVVLVVAIVFAAVWACVIAWWRMGGVAPDAGRMLLWLVLVPIALLSALWIGARLRRSRSNAAAAGADEASRDAAADPADAPAMQRPLAVLATAANLACGGDVHGLAGQLANLPRPRLHPGLRDRDGLPVLAAFTPALETGALDSWQGRRLAPEHLRALALLEPVAADLFDAAARLLPPIPDAEEQVIAGLRRRVETRPEDHGSVAVTALMPRDFPPPLLDDCAAWLRGLAADCGLDARRSRIEVVAGDDAEGTWRRITGLLAERSGDTGEWQLLLAAASWIGERGLQALAAGGRPASGDAEGLIPGEGAAGLLLRPADAVRPAQARPVAEIAALRTDKSGAAASARHAARESAELLAGVMQSSGTGREDVALVVSDADQRPSRSVEAAVAASAACPDLDPVAACPALGTASGHLGHVAPLALLALAAARVEAGAAPVLALSVASATSRTAALLRSEVDAAAVRETPASEPDAAPGVAA